MFVAYLVEPPSVVHCGVLRLIGTNGRLGMDGSRLKNLQYTINSLGNNEHLGDDQYLVTIL